MRLIHIMGRKEYKLSGGGADENINDD